MSEEGNIKPEDECGDPGESCWEGSGAVLEAEAVDCGHIKERRNSQKLSVK